MPITGGCLCGKVRYEIAAEAPNAARQCWCRVCQYFSAGGGTINAMFNKDAIPRHRRDPGLHLDRRQRRGRCAAPSVRPAARRCSAKPTRGRMLIIVRAGTLDDPNLAQAGRDHLDQVGAEMGLLRSGAAAVAATASRRRDRRFAGPARRLASFETRRWRVAPQDEGPGGC